MVRQLLVYGISAEEGKGFPGQLANCVKPHISVTSTDFLCRHIHPNDKNLVCSIPEAIFFQSKFARKKLPREFLVDSYSWNSWV